MPLPYLYSSEKSFVLNVPINEVMATARHTFVRASAIYRVRSGVSQAKRVKALGVNVTTM